MSDNITNGNTGTPCSEEHTAEILTGCPLPDGYVFDDDECEEAAESGKADVEFNCMAIDRLRVATDGNGVTTLVFAWGCPLKCAYCLNPRCACEGTKTERYTPKSLLSAVEKDNIYFSATGGGITFGGGEPLMSADFIAEFKKIIPPEWKINAETCLNVPEEHVKTALGCVDEFIIDIKDMNPEIYRAYTERDNGRVISNLRLICEAGRAADCKIRIPLIPDFNTDNDRQSSKAALEKMGFTRFDLFNYDKEKAENNKKKLI